jgi:hypothetical protein
VSDRRDEVLSKRILQSLFGGEKLPKRRGRMIRCSSCGVLQPAEEVHRAFEEDGQTKGQFCESCW